MRKQFEDLMYHSGLVASGCWDQLDTYDRQAVEKFGELIVQKCLQMVANEANQYDNPVWAVEIVNDICDTFEVSL
jgi:hypothetical protein